MVDPFSSFISFEQLYAAFSAIKMFTDALVSLKQSHTYASVALMQYMSVYVSNALLRERQLYLPRIDRISILQFGVLSLFTLISKHYYFLAFCNRCTTFPVKPHVVIDYSACSRHKGTTFRNGEGFLSFTSPKLKLYSKRARSNAPNFTTLWQPAALSS